MRSKALLVGAIAGMQGPWVNLEGGEWAIPTKGDVYILLPGETHSRREDGHLYVSGPIRLRAIVSDSYTGEPIHLDARQVANA